MRRAPFHDLHVSNLLTYTSLAAAVGACVLALTPKTLPLAAAAVGVAVIADTFDGKFARLFTRSERQARTGMETDSLVDAIAFGAAPVVVVIAAAAQSGIGPVLPWFAAVVYSLAVVTRLAFYNLEQDSTVFVGAPTPAAALLCMTALLASTSVWMATAALLISGGLMVAPITIPRPRGFALGLFAAWGVMAIALHVARY
jgi:CDP-diacylglycerol--serine O-phosphatidyltransferase